VGAGSVADTGYEFCGDVTDADIKMPRVTRFSEGILTHIDEVKPAAMSEKDGWKISDLRLPIGGHNGSSTTLFWAKYLPGAVHQKHRFDRCETLYYVIRGHGLAGAGPDRVELRGGHVHYIPKGVEHFLCNLSASEPLEAIGIYIGASSIDDAGYVYLGDVSAADRAARTA
jgi:mannose-6-phosphate isomerase-like protein (cupin superfamily)